MLVLVGSRAAEVIQPGILGRSCADWDFIGTYDDVQAFLRRRQSVLGDQPSRHFNAIYPERDGRKIIACGPELICEFEIAWEGTTARELFDAVMRNKDADYTRVLLGADHSQPRCPDLGDVFWLPTLDQIYTLKLSHRYLRNSPHFWKTIADVAAFRRAGAKIWDEDWLRRREEETYDYKHPKLDVKKDEFFKGDGVTYVYDHDSVHEAMKHLERPAYAYFKPADREVLCDKEMFFAADERVRLYSVLEEAQVLALERSQIPHPGVWSLEKSFRYALMKVCTSITSGWWREWAWEHHDQVAAMYEPDYVERFWRAVEAGVVKRTAAR